MGRGGALGDSAGRATAGEPAAAADAPDGIRVDTLAMLS